MTGFPLTTTEYLYHRWSQIFSVCRNISVVYHRIFSKSSTKMCHYWRRNYSHFRSISANPRFL